VRMRLQEATGASRAFVRYLVVRVEFHSRARSIGSPFLAPSEPVLASVDDWRRPDETACLISGTARPLRRKPLPLRRSPSGATTHDPERAPARPAGWPAPALPTQFSVQPPHTLQAPHPACDRIHLYPGSRLAWFSPTSSRSSRQFVPQNLPCPEDARAHGRLVDAQSCRDLFGRHLFDRR